MAKRDRGTEVREYK